MGKGPGVQKMFDDIAPNYDLMNRVMTMGQDQGWRRFVVKKAGDPGSGLVLDLATGTGDIAALMEKQHPDGKHLGADFSLNMLSEAKKDFPVKPLNGRPVMPIICPTRITVLNL